MKACENCKLDKENAHGCRVAFRRKSYLPLALCVGFVVWAWIILFDKHERPDGFLAQLIENLLLAGGSFLASSVLAVFLLIADFFIEYMREKKERYILIILAIFGVSVLAAVMWA